MKNLQSSSMTWLLTKLTEQSFSYVLIPGKTFKNQEGLIDFTSGIDSSLIISDHPIIFQIHSQRMGRIYLNSFNPNELLTSWNQTEVYGTPLAFSSYESEHPILWNLGLKGIEVLSLVLGIHSIKSLDNEAMNWTSMLVLRFSVKAPMDS